MLIYDTLTIILLYVNDDKNILNLSKDFNKACMYNRKQLLNKVKSKKRFIKKFIKQLPSNVLENVTTKHCDLQSLIDNQPSGNIIDFNKRLLYKLYESRDEKVYETFGGANETLAYGFHIKSCYQHNIYKSTVHIKDHTMFMEHTYNVIDETRYDKDELAKFIDMYKYKECKEIIDDGANYLVIYYINCGFSIPQNYEGEVMDDILHKYNLYDDLHLSGANEYTVKIDTLYYNLMTVCVMANYYKI
jgi:hypothetical protein